MEKVKPNENTTHKNVQNEEKQMSFKITLTVLFKELQKIPILFILKDILPLIYSKKFIYIEKYSNFSHIFQSTQKFKYFTMNLTVFLREIKSLMFIVEYRRLKFTVDI